MSIKYIEGDLFADLPKEDDGIIRVIPHVVNSWGKWGAGFVVPLGNKFPKARESYLEWHKRKTLPQFELGVCEPVLLADSLYVIHMLAQEGLGGKRPLRYNALVHCLDAVGRFCKGLQQDNEDCNVKIIAPAFGAGLGGGDWRVIEPLIHDCWYGLDVTIYYLPGTLPGFPRD